MPDTRTRRGAHPEDPRLFAEAALPALRTAVAEYSWLLGRGYAEPGAIKLVGDRHSLDERQRIAVRRCSCPDAALAARLSREVPCGPASPGSLAGRTVWLDGFNVLNTLEVALGGGVVLTGRDGCRRDLAGVHGTYRSVADTEAAVALAADFLSARGVASAVWWLDAPVGNSGRLAARLREVAAARSLPWEVRVVPDPDRELGRRDGDPSAAPPLVATADSVVLDRCGPWINLVGGVLDERVPDAWTVDLRGGA
jgi:hypothetical protein